jgi:hypothetical protein
LKSTAVSRRSAALRAIGVRGHELVFARVLQTAG